MSACLAGFRLPFPRSRRCATWRQEIFHVRLPSRLPAPVSAIAPLRHLAPGCPPLSVPRSVPVTFRQRVDFRTSLSWFVDTTGVALFCTGGPTLPSA